MDAGGAPNFWLAECSPACDPSEPSSHPPLSVRHGTRQPSNAQAVPDRTTTESGGRGQFQKLGPLLGGTRASQGPSSVSNWRPISGQPEQASHSRGFALQDAGAPVEIGWLRGIWST